MTFAMVLPLPRTNISAGTGLECFLAHAGSASMESGLRAGGFPVKVMVPVTVDAATATPGQPNSTTSPAASHNLIPVPRMLSSLIIANLVSVVTVDAAFRPSQNGADSNTPLAVGATLAQPRVKTRAKCRRPELDRNVPYHHSLIRAAGTSTPWVSCLARCDVIKPILRNFSQGICRVGTAVKASDCPVGVAESMPVFPKSANPWSRPGPVDVLVLNTFRERPVQFSHQHHVGGIGTDCRECRAGRESRR